MTRNNNSRRHDDPVRVAKEPKADLFKSICRDSKDPGKCRLFVERLEESAFNITR